MGSDSDARFPISDALGQRGYIDRSGGVCIEARYTAAGPFSEGLAWVMSPVGIHCIDTRGKLQCTLNRHDGHNSLPAPFSEGLSAIMIQVGRDILFRHVNSRGQFTYPPRKGRVGSFSNGLAKASEFGLHGFIAASGRWVIAPEFQAAGDFIDGLACVQRDGEWGVIDPGGEFVLAPRALGELRAASKGIFIYAEAGQFGLMALDGRVVAAPVFDSISRGAEGIHAVVRAGRHGLIGPQGDWVLEPNFELSLPVSEGLAVIGREGRLGYVDSTGDLVIPHRFSSAESFVGGLARVIEPGGESSSVEGYIRRDGEWVFKRPVYCFKQTASAAGPQAERAESGRGFFERLLSWTKKISGR